MNFTMNIIVAGIFLGNKNKLMNFCAEVASKIFLEPDFAFHPSKISPAPRAFIFEIWFLIFDLERATNLLAIDLLQKQ